MEKAMEEYHQEHGYWPEYTWSELDVKLPTMTVIAQCGPNQPEHRISGQTLVYHTGYLNTPTSLIEKQ